MMQERSVLIQDFITALREAIRRATGPAHPAEAASDRIFTALAIPAQSNSLSTPAWPKVCDFLDEAFANAADHAPQLQPVISALQALSPALHWAPRKGAQAAGAAFAEGHANAILIGPGGLELRDDVQIGVSLMAPNVTYPDHTHPPEEVYLVLSPGFWRQDKAPWVEPGFGGIVLNPPNIIHAMRSGDQPLLAIWCLWLAGARPI